MSLGGIRANGVRTLAAWYLGRSCNHRQILGVSGSADDLPGNAPTLVIFHRYRSPSVDRELRLTLFLELYQFVAFN